METVKSKKEIVKELDKSKVTKHLIEAIKYSAKGNIYIAEKHACRGLFYGYMIHKTRKLVDLGYLLSSHSLRLSPILYCTQANLLKGKVNHNTNNILLCLNPRNVSKRMIKFVYESSMKIAQLLIKEGNDKDALVILQKLTRLERLTLYMKRQVQLFINNISRHEEDLYAAA